MSLAKIPVLVVLPYAYKIVSTSPNPTAPKEETVPTTIDWIPGRNFSIRVLQIGMTLAAAVEIATILAIKFSPSSVSQAILSVFIFQGGDPSKIRLSFLGTLGATLWILGTAMRIVTYKELGRFFVFEISIQKNHQLITTGPYAYVRHPSYIGLVLVDVGWLLWTCTEGSWVRESGFWDTKYGPAVFIAFFSFVLVGPAVTLTRMSEEDEVLKKQFGRKWDEWAKKVPYRLIPGIY